MLLIGLFYDIFLDCHVLIQHRFTADVVFRPRKDDREICTSRIEGFDEKILYFIDFFIISRH